MEWLNVLIAVCLPLAIFLLLPSSNARRALLVVLVLILGFRYLQWRLMSFPWRDGWIQAQWWWWLIVLVVEAAVMIEVALFLTSITYLSDRKQQAKRAEMVMRHQYAMHGMTVLPSVDIFIATYNEGPEIIEKSILGALAVDYPNFEVYVLDDGSRVWLQVFCLQVGANYITRATNQGAKAGNINNALRRSSGSLILILDADFICFSNALWKVSGLFHNERIATVQTPQCFFNPDALQHSLGISSSWSDEQSFFFRLIARGRDALGVTFCCGSCSMHRRTALVEVGGFPTESITEDILLTIRLCARGWQTIYLAEPLAIGLAPETLESFFVQRKRWGRGGIQVAWLMLGTKGLNFIQRTFFFPFSWITQYNSRLFFQFIPIVFFATGIAPIPNTEDGYLIHLQLPFLLALVVSMTILSDGFYLPVYSEGISLFASFELAPEILAAIIKPFGTGFSVTPKGHDSISQTTHCYTKILIPSSILLAINIAILLRIAFAVGSRVSESSQMLLIYGCAWCCLNSLLLILSVYLSLQRKQPRLEHRMSIGRPCRLIIQPLNGNPIQSHAGFLVDLSLSGALFKADEIKLNSSANNLLLEIENALAIPIHAAQSRASNRVALTFAGLSNEIKQKLVGYAFSGRFEPAEQTQVIKPMRTLVGIARALAKGSAADETASRQSQ